MNAKNRAHNLAVLQRLQAQENIQQGSPEEGRILAKVMQPGPIATVPPKGHTESKEEQLKYKGGPTGEDL